MTAGKNNDLSRRIASVLPPRDDMTASELIELADSVIGVGMRIAGIIHDEDPADAARLVAGLTPDRAWALPFVLAAMVDIEKTATQLFAWAPFTVPNRLVGVTSVAPNSQLLRSRPQPANECGTQRGFEQHKAHDDEPCDACWIAHRGWEADKKRTHRDRARPTTVREDALTALMSMRPAQLDLFAPSELQAAVSRAA